METVVTPEVPKKTYQGWRYFHCEKCKFKWRETCRDASTPSGSICPRSKHITSPFKFKLDATVQVDDHKNLSGPTLIEPVITPSGHMLRIERKKKKKRKISKKSRKRNRR